MASLLSLVRNAVQEALSQALPDLIPTQEILEVTPATSEKFGHYQYNGAMRLAQQLRKAPREIASLVVAALPRELFSHIEIAGPGFINFFFTPSLLAAEIKKNVQDKHLGIALPEKPQRIIVEFSSPNIAKEMHVGHLRSTIIGDSIARLLEFLGHNVLRLNHLGDWGTAFGMLIAYMREEVPLVFSGEQAADLPTLMGWYKESKKRFDSDEAFKLRAREAVVALQGGDPDILTAWRKICEISEWAYQEIYDLLDVRIEPRGESFYNPHLSEVVKELEAKGLVTISEGAKCLFCEGYALPLMVQKSDGGYNYDTTDMAAMRYRVAVDQADRIIVITDAGQTLHFQLIYQASLKAGYLDPQKVQFDHLTFGLVLGTDGKKFRTRSGETEKLIDLLHKAIEAAAALLQERGYDPQDPHTRELAHVLGVDAVKYADLSTNRQGDYLFSYEKMLRFEGNTATFILYSYVRVSGIKRKLGITDLRALIESTPLTIEHPSEIALAVHLLQFQETLEAVAHTLFPNHLTDYLYNLAQKFNLFFRDCRVEGDPQQNSRLILCEATARTLSVGLHILGLRLVEQM